MPIPRATYEQRLSFETEGYLVIENALALEELSMLRGAADRAERQWREDVTRRGWRKEDSEQIQSIIEYGDEFIELAAHPKILPVVRDALGDDLALLFSDYFITPPRARSPIHWHRDARILGPYHPRSRMFAKAFILLSDVAAEGGPTALVPGSHRFDDDWEFPAVEDPRDMPGHVKMAYPAGTIYFTHGRIYHSAMPNMSDTPRRVLAYCYGHSWMKPWQGYEPSAEVQTRATTNLMRQLFHLGDAYRYRYDLDDDVAPRRAPDEEYRQRHVQKPGRGLN
jgi:ectoine hydroxylase-related dioxygenase (phytanoyl-CoA dioxygenase family)